MADGAKITEGSGPIVIDTDELNLGGRIVHRQRVQLGNDTEDVAELADAAPASDATGLVVRVVGGVESTDADVSAVLATILSELEGKFEAGQFVKIQNAPTDYPLPSAQFQVLATEDTLQEVVDALTNNLREGGTVALDAATKSALQDVKITPKAGTVFEVQLPGGGTIASDDDIAAARIAIVTSVEAVANTLRTELDELQDRADLLATDANLLALRADIDILRGRVDLLARESTLAGMRSEHANAAAALQARADQLAADETLTDGSQRAQVQKSLFTRLIKFEPLDTEEVRSEETPLDRFHGFAPDGADPADPVWAVARFYKGLFDEIERTRMRTDIAWTDRSSGWS